MPPKESVKPKKKPEPPPPQYFDDRGAPCDFEKWMGNLKKKYIMFCKANNESPPMSQLLAKIKAALEEEKEFTTLGLSGLDINGAHILPLVQFMQVYGKIQRLAFGTPILEMMA